jgi:seryl-tRNA synthetase
MHDMNFIRKNRTLCEQKLRSRGLDDNSVARLLDLDVQLRRVIVKLEANQAEANKVSRRVGDLFKAKQISEADRAKGVAKQLTEEIRESERQKTQLEAEISSMVRQLPNFLHDSVPIGTNSTHNVEIRRWGTPREFDFIPRPHWEIGERLGILDIERGSKLAGGRFAVYRDAGARLERAIANFMLDVHTRESGYTEILPPFVANSQALFGTGNLPKFEAELYRLENSDLWLIPTAEVSLTNLFANEIVAAELLPIKVTAWTPCFRREAGSYGRDVRGILRQHQFQKVELVKISRPDQSYGDLDTLVEDAEKILQRLEIPYRIVLLCTGDTGFASSKTLDIEVWLPGQNAFREISSCSNCEAFQARRANIRFRSEPGVKPSFVHTLNGSGLAVGRTWLAILENYQQKDGSVQIPAVLQPYMHGMTVITPKV